MPGPAYHGWTHSPDGTDPIPAATGTPEATSPSLYLPFAPGLVVAHRENPKRYPGGWRVVPPETWAWDSTVIDDIGIARQQLRHDHQAANYDAASEDTIIANSDAWDLKPDQTYRIYIGYRADTDVLSTGHIVLRATGASDLDLATSGGVSARYAIATLGERSFAANTDINIRAFHTTASAGYLYIDQLYFVPTGLAYDETVGTGFYGDRDYLKFVYLPTAANIGNAGVTTPADKTFSDAALAIADTQQIKWLYDSTMRPTAWAASFEADAALIAEYGSVDFDRRNARHTYVLARTKKDSAEGPNSARHTIGGHVSLFAGAHPVGTASVQSTCAAFYYLGMMHWFIEPDQWVCWRNTDYNGSNDSPWSSSADGSLIDDVRIADVLFSSAVLDDH